MLTMSFARDYRPTTLRCNNHCIFNTYVQSFRNGYPDGGSICVESCCLTHYEGNRPSEWNFEPQYSCEEDASLSNTTQMELDNQ